MAGRPREFDRDLALQQAMLAFWPVSYTHLDVYKRQVYWRSAFREAMDIPLQDDSDYVHFSFNSRMRCV